MNERNNKTSKQKRIIIALIIALTAMVILLAIVLLVKKGKLFGSNTYSGVDATEEPLNDDATGTNIDNLNGSDVATVTEAETTEEPEEIWDAVISKDGLVAGNDNYVIYEMDVVGNEYSGDSNNEINISTHFNYDFENRTITSTRYSMLDHSFVSGDENYFRYDIPEVLNIYNVGTVVDNDFLMDFDKIVEDDQHWKELSFNDDGIITQSEDVSESEYGAGQWSTDITYDDKGRLVETKYNGEGDSANTTTWTYDDAGNITEVNDSTETRTYEYNSDGYPVTCHSNYEWADSGTNKDFEYTYDDQNRITSIVCHIKEYQYIDANTTEDVSEQEINANIEYDENGNATEIGIHKIYGHIQYNVHYSYRYATVEDLKNGVTPPKSEDLTRSQIFEGVFNYSVEDNPDLLTSKQEGKYMVGWCMEEDDYPEDEYPDEISVSVRSYTGATETFYVNKYTGDVRITQFAPGIMEEPEEMGDTFNVHDYTDRD